MWPPPPEGSDFPLWPTPRDRTFRCGPPRGIGLSAVAPPEGSDFPLWPPPRDRTFRYGPPRKIGLSAMAPPGGSAMKNFGNNFPHWPPPEDSFLRCGPRRGIELSAVAPAGRSTATPRDRSNILWEPAAAFKGTIYEESVYGVAILYKTYNIQALDLL